jgi:Zn-dependent protease with chaperone function
MKSIWNVNLLISSYWGMYAIQTVLHSLIASLISYCALLAWDFKTPHVKQRFFFMVIFLPVISFPLYQMLYPQRGDVYFRLDSLLDSNKWFLMDISGIAPVLALFVVILALTSIVFVVQELVPIALNLLNQPRGGDESDDDEVEEAVVLKVSEALTGLPLNENSVEIISDDDLVLFSSTGFNPKIYVSTGLITSFSHDHLQAAFAHEIGHIQRSRKPVLLFAYILRVLMFYNPIAMIEFRKLAQEEEKVCDDIAIALTGKPEALAEAIDMLRPATEGPKAGTNSKGVEGVVMAIEDHSHDALLKSRGFRIRHSLDDNPDWGIPYLVTLVLIICLNYFIV